MYLCGISGVLSSLASQVLSCRPPGSGDSCPLTQAYAGGHFLVPFVDGALPAPAAFSKPARALPHIRWGARAGSPPSLCAVLQCWLSRPGAQLDLNLTCNQKPLLSFPSFCAPVRAGVQRVNNRNTRVSLLNLTLLFVDSSQGTISSNTEMGFLSLFLLMS